MKRIILTEGQFRRLMEVSEYDDGNLKEYPGSTVGLSTTIHDDEGDIEMGNDTNSDRIGRFQTHQVFGSCDGFCRR